MGSEPTGEGRCFFRMHGATPFVEGRYFLPDGEESPELAEDFEGYDPETEFMAGYEVSGPDGDPVGLWIGRMTTRMVEVDE